MTFLTTTKEGLNVEPGLGLRNVGFDIKAGIQGNEYTLTLKGFLAPGWSGRLAAGLAGYGIDIVMGEAERVTSAAWHSTFKLKTGLSKVDPLTIDYAALASIELPQDKRPARLELRGFTMETCGRSDGSLLIEIRGVDRLGFLGDLLDYFSMRCLFPVKMSIATHGGTAVDKFWLKGVGGSIPSESLAGALKESLESLVLSNA